MAKKKFLLLVLSFLLFAQQREEKSGGGGGGGIDVAKLQGASPSLLLFSLQCDQNFVGKIAKFQVKISQKIAFLLKWFFFLELLLFLKSKATFWSWQEFKNRTNLQ